MEAVFPCPAGGPAGPIDELGYIVWGSNPYTDDSSVCRAAVHVGAITVTDGGEVTIRVLAGLAAYPASMANGVQTQMWDAWGGSFEVVVP